MLSYLKGVTMKFNQNHEPQMKDMDDFHKPLKKSKRRIILLSFVALLVIWGLFQFIGSMF